MKNVLLILLVINLSCGKNVNLKDEKTTGGGDENKSQVTTPELENLQLLYLGNRVESDGKLTIIYSARADNVIVQDSYVRKVITLKSVNGVAVNKVLLDSSPKPSTGLKLTSAGGGSMLALIDDSGSLASADPNDLRLDAVHELIEIFSGDLALFRFSSGDPPHEMLHDFSRDQKSLHDSVIGDSSGGTYLYESGIATYKALQSHSSGSGKKFMIIFSDGEPNDLDLETVKAEFMGLITSRSIPIYTVGFGVAAENGCGSTTSLKASGVLKDIANGSGGAFTSIANAKDIKSAFNAIGFGSSNNIINSPLDLKGISEIKSGCNVLDFDVTIESLANPDESSTISFSSVIIK